MCTELSNHVLVLRKGPWGVALGHGQRARAQERCLGWRTAGIIGPGPVPHQARRSRPHAGGSLGSDSSGHLPAPHHNRKTSWGLPSIQPLRAAPWPPPRQEIHTGLSDASSEGRPVGVGRERQVGKWGQAPPLPCSQAEVPGQLPTCILSESWAIPGPGPTGEHPAQESSCQILKCRQLGLGNHVTLCPCTGGSQNPDNF